MRWWLALLFAAIAAMTALIVAQVFRSSSESAIRDRAGELTAGTAVAAAAQIASAASAAEAAAIAGETANRRRVAVFVFDRNGHLVSSDRSAGVALDDLVDLEPALQEALAGRRFVEQTADSAAVTVALPIRQSETSAALVAYATRPDLEDALGIVQDEIISAALKATVVGAGLGLVVAILITRRLRRVATAASAIEQGDFERRLTSRFPDELGMLAVTVDQMRERLAESFASLGTERDRLQQLLGQLQEAVVAVDRELVVKFANSRARDLLEGAARPGRPLTDPPWHGIELRAFASRLFGPLAEPTTVTVRPDDDRTFLLSGIPARRIDETAVVVVADVTTRERRERAEREFVANAAHQLRTPLTAISSAVEVLQQGAKEDAEERDRFLTLIERQSERLGELVRSLLTLARAQTGVEPVSRQRIVLAPVIEDVVADAEDATISIDCPPELAVHAQRELLRQALENLVQNALTHGRGADVRVWAYPAGEDVHVAVSDRGPGMAGPELERVGSRFHRGNGGVGHGLGLAIAFEVVRVMKGELSIETSPGGGFTALIELARARDDAEGGKAT
jgi:two-component system phosphate regulon sensor histidine kinase PhoR